MVKLSVLIPTYNRAPKLKRTLEEVVRQITEADLGGVVDVVVSDNASTDDTSTVVAGIAVQKVSLHYVRQPVNSGIDGNMARLYRELRADYGWFLSDDDLLAPNAVRTIFLAVEEHRPTALVFSFKQPADCPYPTFDYTEPVRLITNAGDIVPHMIKCVKISIYVYKRQSLAAGEWQKLERYLGTNWWWLALGFSLCDGVPGPKLAVISQVLATSDRDFMQIRFGPETWARFSIVLEHPFVQKHRSELLEYHRRNSYLSGISFIFAVETGVMVSADPEAYRAAALSLPFQWRILVRKPGALARLILLRLGIAKVAYRCYQMSKSEKRHYKPSQ